ncbi:hypothetical protein JRQ81_012333 [Phrynocephalus forsythii]|uniref:Uncharacterized protein n=1 Tax=Phrynocephalus forsythii TaxID=171643 RepID=A0A9Q0Y225_9SAUR|nr:hypothetical protein JRQ81_012333 [Phrynocephalus forsythii]
MFRVVQTSAKHQSGKEDFSGQNTRRATEGRVFLVLPILTVAGRGMWPQSNQLVLSPSPGRCPDVHVGDNELKIRL